RVVRRHGRGGPVGAGIEPAWAPAVLLVPAWAAALLSMGYGQWVVLRRAVPQSSRWVAVTGGTWLLGVMIPITALSVVPNDWPPLAFFVVGVASAVAMGLTVGAVTGGALERLLASQPGPVRPVRVAVHRPLGDKPQGHGERRRLLEHRPRTHRRELLPRAG
ncbi:MAG TPA: hypothetical protein VGR21_12345, partial [Cryptosporangiaceae bacterium]|nr:hypothetical protein [Cryptosporangiaceae bacterium]